jgi:hypothetical protein
MGHIGRFQLHLCVRVVARARRSRFGKRRAADLELGDDVVAERLS